MLDDLAEFDKRRAKGSVSLNEAERKQERDALEAKLKAREKENGGEAEKPQASAAAAEAALEADEDGDEAPKKPAKKAKDALLYEAAYALGDEAELLKTRSAAAAWTPEKPPRAKKDAH